MVIFMILYINDILLIRNVVGLFSLVEIRLCTQFQMKDVGEVQCILGIKVLKDHMNRKIVLSQATYIDKLILVTFQACNVSFLRLVSQNIYRERSHENNTLDLSNG